jgi:hypothetical protein
MDINLGDMTQRKVEWLLKEAKPDNPVKVSGVILQYEDGTRTIVEMGAVRHMDNDDFWDVMHPKECGD